MEEPGRNATALHTGCGILIRLPTMIGSEGVAKELAAMRIWLGS